MARIQDASLPTDIGAVMRNNLHRALYNNVPMADLFCALARGVHQNAAVPQRVRELGILRIAATLKAEVEWAQHFRIAQMAGVSVEEARALCDGDLSMFGDSDRAAILLMDAVEGHAMTDLIWLDAARYLAEGELLDLVMIAGFYGYASRITLALDVAVDDGLRRIAES